MVAIPVGDVRGCWRQTKWRQDNGDVGIKHINNLSNPRRNRANQDSGTQAREGKEQNHFLEIRDAVLVTVEGRDEEVFCWVVEVAELCAYESFHPCGDLVDPFLQAFVSAIGSEYEGFVIRAHRCESLCRRWLSSLWDANFPPPSQ